MRHERRDRFSAEVGNRRFVTRGALHDKTAACAVAHPGCRSRAFLRGDLSRFSEPFNHIDLDNEEQ